MEIDPNLAEQAIRDALNRFPGMEAFGPRLIWRPLSQGGAFMLDYAVQPPRDHSEAWEFQNAVVRAYKALSTA